MSLRVPGFAVEDDRNRIAALFLACRRDGEMATL